MFIHESVTVFFLGIALINIRCFYGQPATDEDEEKKEENSNDQAASTSTPKPSKTAGLLVLPREFQVNKTSEKEENSNDQGASTSTPKPSKTAGLLVLPSEFQVNKTSVSKESFSPTKDNFLPWILGKLSNPADENVSQGSRSNEEAGVFRSPGNYVLPKTSELPVPSFILREPKEKAPLPSYIFRKTKEEAKREHRQIAPVESQFSMRTTDQRDKSYLEASTDEDRLPRVPKVGHSSKFPHVERPYVRDIRRSPFLSNKPIRPTASHVLEQAGDRSYSKSSRNQPRNFDVPKIKFGSSGEESSSGRASVPRINFGSFREESSSGRDSVPIIKFGSIGEESSIGRVEAVQAEARRTKKSMSIQIQSRESTTDSSSMAYRDHSSSPREKGGSRFRQNVRWEKKRSPTTEDEKEESIQRKTPENTSSRFRDSEGSPRIYSPRYPEKKYDNSRLSSSPQDIIYTSERMKKEDKKPSSSTRMSPEEERSIQMGGQSKGKGKISEKVEIDSKPKSPHEKCILIVSKGNKEDSDIFEEIERANLNLTNVQTKLVKSQKAALITCKSKQEADNIRKSVRRSGTLDIKPMKTFPCTVRIHHVPMEIEESDIIRAVNLKFGEDPQEIYFFPYQDQRKDRLKIAKLNIGCSLLQQMEASPFIWVKKYRLRINTWIIVSRCKKCHLLGHFAKRCNRVEREFPPRQEPCIDCINSNRQNKIKDPETGRPIHLDIYHPTDSPNCPTKQFYIHKWKRNQQSVDILFEDSSEEDSDEAQIEEYEINEQKNSSSEEEEEGKEKTLEHASHGEKEEDQLSEDILFAGEEEEKSKKKIQTKEISTNAEHAHKGKEILEEHLLIGVEDKEKISEKGALPEQEMLAKEDGPMLRVGLVIMPRNEEVDVFTELENLNILTDPCVIEDVLSFPSGSILLQCYSIEGAQCLEKHIKKSENLELL